MKEGKKELRKNRSNKQIKRGMEEERDIKKNEVDRDKDRNKQVETDQFSYKFLSDLTITTVVNSNFTMKEH